MTEVAKTPVLIATRGLPGSGKTTKARAWVAVDPLRRKRVNRDDLRAMMHNGAHIPGGGDTDGTEKSIVRARDALITRLLQMGVDVICDDTNLPVRVIRDLRRLATLTGADFEVWDLTDVQPDVCIERDAQRGDKASIGKDVITDMFYRFLRGKPYPLPMPADDVSDDPSDVVPYVRKPGSPKAVIVDIDGTVALMAARSPYDESRVHEDRPNLAVIGAVQAMHAADYAIIFCSGRTSACREATEKWLIEHVDVPYTALYMRREGDRRKDSVVKLELFNEHIRDYYDVRGVFDDRQQVVDMWRSLGLTVFQVAPGNF